MLKNIFENWYDPSFAFYVFSQNYIFKSCDTEIYYTQKLFD